jgi:hypothetical protein
MRGALIVPLLMLAAPAAAQAPPEVEEVRLEGVTAVSPALLRAALETRATRCRTPLLAPVCALGAGRTRAFLDTAAVRRDEARIDSLYGISGFPQARTRATVEPRGWAVAVSFQVQEGPPLVVASLDVRGLDALPRPVELAPLPLRVGAPYSLPRLEASQRAIARAAAEQGYAFARVEVGGELAADQRSAGVVLELVPGPRAVFGPTLVRAGAPLRERDVRGRLAYRVGEPFSPGALERTVEQLYGLPIVQNARLVPRPAATADSVVEVEAVVEAGRATAYGLDAVVSGSSCVGGTVNLASRYFLGAPREVSISAGGSNLFARALHGFPCTGASDDEFSDPDYFVRTSLREPVGTRSHLLLDAAFERRSAARAYVRRGVRGRVGYARLLGRGTDALVAYAPERSDNEEAAAFYCGLRGTCAGPALAELRGTRTLAPVEASLGWRSPGPLRPPPGPRLDTVAGMARWRSTARLSLSGAGAATGSELAFGTAQVDGSVTRLAGPRTDLLLRARAGILMGGSDLPPHLRLFGGGPLGVRGVPANLLGPRLLVVREGDEEEIGCALAAGACEGLLIDPDRVHVRAAGGDALVEASVEARFWATRIIQLAAFVDFGAVRAEGSRTETLVTPGIGIGVVTPVAPLRIDVAYNPSGARSDPLLVRDPAGDGYIPLGNVRSDPPRRLQLQFSVF